MVHLLENNDFASGACGARVHVYVCVLSARSPGYALLCFTQRGKQAGTVRLKLSERVIYAGMILISSSSSCARAHLSSARVRVLSSVRLASRRRRADVTSYIYKFITRIGGGRVDACIVVIITRQNGGLCKSGAFIWSTPVCVFARDHTRERKHILYISIGDIDADTHTQAHSWSL